MTYTERIQSELQTTLSSANTPKWAHPPIIAAGSTQTSMRQLSHTMLDCDLVRRATHGGTALEHVSKIKDGWVHDATKALQTHSVFDRAVLRADADVVLGLFKIRGVYLPINAFKVFTPGDSWTQEDVELALRFQTDKVPEWAKTPLQEAARIDLHPHQLLHLAADCDILGALMKDERAGSVIEAWVQSDIPDWMRLALVEFRIAEDRWGRYRIAAIPPVLIKLIGIYYGTQNQGERSQ